MDFGMISALNFSNNNNALIDDWSTKDESSNMRANPKPCNDFPYNTALINFETFDGTNIDISHNGDADAVGDIVSASENDDFVTDDDDCSENSSDELDDEETKQEEQDFLDTIRFSVPTISEVNEREIDSELAQELNNLSMRDREKALHDIHGVADKIHESPEVLQRALRELEDALEERRGTPKALAYNLALGRNGEYVRGDEFRLLFLRGHDFDAIAAAKMTLQHFLIKKELFGDDKLCKDIELSDMTEADLECLRNGHFQLLPVCDQAGRQVFIHFMTQEKYKCPPNMVRSFVRYITIIVDYLSAFCQQALGPCSFPFCLLLLSQHSFFLIV
jgi:hypothetical protein